METTNSPHLHDLQFRGYIEGLTIKDKGTGRPICHYFGGVPYAVPPTGELRWRVPRELAPCYRYGTRTSPGIFNGEAAVCPQVGKKISSVDENCLECNIWVPAGDPPSEGWPVYFYIFGGFLQVGSSNSGSPVALLAETDLKCIVVKPTYRLNVFGFLASRELQAEASATGVPYGNFGFWDLRLALEWTYKNISYFGGNPSNITVGGYSAGAHAAFHSLAYDIALEPSKRIIKRLIMHSNGPGLQPKSPAESQLQFDELLSVLDIPASAPNKLALLRAKSVEELLGATMKMKTYHQFRAVSDGRFVRESLFLEIQDGTFARRMRAANVHLLTGECSDEHFEYAMWRRPGNSLGSVYHRLLADYPRAACDALVAYYFPGGKLPPQWKNWREAFGRVYADVQIHVSQRGFFDALQRRGAGDLVHRYRIEWRAACVDERVPKEFGVTHGTDAFLWWWGNGRTLQDQEKPVVRAALLNGLSQFIKGDKLDWDTATVKEARRLRSDGEYELWKDTQWEEGVRVWKALQDATLQQDIVRARI